NRRPPRRRSRPPPPPRRVTERPSVVLGARLICGSSDPVSDSFLILPRHSLFGNSSRWDRRSPERRCKSQLNRRLQNSPQKILCQSVSPRLKKTTESEAESESEETVASRIWLTSLISKLPFGRATGSCQAPVGG